GLVETRLLPDGEDLDLVQGLHEPVREPSSLFSLPDHRHIELNRGLPEDGPDQPHQEQGEEDAPEDRTPVPEVGEEAHPDHGPDALHHSRSSLPVSWRKTSSRLACSTRRLRKASPSAACSSLSPRKVAVASRVRRRTVGPPGSGTETASTAGRRRSRSLRGSAPGSGPPLGTGRPAAGVARP